MTAGSTDTHIPTGAKRLVLDSVDSLFLTFSRRRGTRRELLRLLHPAEQST